MRTKMNLWALVLAVLAGAALVPSGVVPSFLSAQPQPGAGVFSTLRTTGAGAFGGSVTIAGDVTSTAAIPRLTLIESDGTADNRRWAYAAEADNLSLQAVNDAASVGVIAMEITRTGTTIDTVQWNAGGAERARASASGFSIGSSGTPIASVVSGSATWDPGSVATGAATSASLSITGVTVLSVCLASHSTASTNAIALTAHPSAADTVRVVLTNNSGGAVDLTSGTVRATCFQH